MVSEIYSIEAFVETVKEMNRDEVILTAIREAEQADRIRIKATLQPEKERLAAYSQQLKQLINYHRFTVKPHRSRITTYNLYMKHWGASSMAPVDGSV